MIRITECAKSIQPTQIRQITSLAKPSSLHLGIGQPDLQFPKSVQDAVVNFSQQGFAPYVPNAGTGEARSAIANYLGSTHTADEILITSGVQEAMALAIFATVQIGDELLVPDPGFPAYPNLVRATGAVPIAYKLTREWQLDIEDIVSKFTTRTRAIILNSPGNPTGVTLSADSIRELEAICFERNIVIISDEIYSKFVYGNAPFLSLKSFLHRGHIVLDGLSKTHAMMGFRLGWICAEPEFIKSITPLHQHWVTSASSIAQHAAIAALADSDSSIFETMEKRFQRTSTLVRDFYSENQIDAKPVADSAFYFMLALSNDNEIIDDLSFAKQLLLECDVVTIPGSGFGAAGQGYLRIAYTAPVDILEEAFSRLNVFYRSFRQNEKKV